MAATGSVPVRPLLARLFVGGIHKVLDRFDDALETGSLMARLPDGTTRMLGGRKPGFDAEITLRDWRSLLRLATGGSVGFYQAWEAGEWESPDPVALFALVIANSDTMGETGRAKGPVASRRRSCCTGSTATRASRPNATSMRITISATISTRAWLDPTMSYSSGLDFAGWRPGGIAAQQVAKAGTAPRQAGKPARDRLRLGRAEQLFRRARQQGHRHQPVGRTAATGRGSRHAGRDRVPPSGLPRCHRTVRRDRQRRNGRGGRPRILAGLLRLPGPQPEARRTCGDPVHRDARGIVRMAMRAMPISSSPISSRAAC